VLLETIARLRELGSAPGDLLLALGPSIGPCCFEVGAEVAIQFPAEVRRPRAEQRAQRACPTVDLRAALRLQLDGAGIAADNIDHAAPCTFCDPARRFPSYRRDGAAAGRLTSWIRAKAC
jgi:copper oxidase (laccase) domain-containing protein